MISCRYWTKFSFFFVLSYSPISSYRFALCFAVAKLISSSPMFYLFLATGPSNLLITLCLVGKQKKTRQPSWVTASVTLLKRWSRTNSSSLTSPAASSAPFPCKNSRFVVRSFSSFCVHGPTLTQGRLPYKYFSTKGIPKTKSSFLFQIYPALKLHVLSSILCFLLRKHPLIC